MCELNIAKEKQKAALNIALRPTKRGQYEIMLPYKFKEVTVPQYTTTDGLSIVRFARLMVNRFEPLYMPAAVVHDHLCELEMYEMADRYFEELLTVLELGKLTKKSKVMLWVVKKYHWIRYGVK